MACWIYRSGARIGISLSNYDNELVIKLFHYDTSITEVSEPQTVLLQVGSTYGDLKEAAHTLFGVEKDFALFTKVEYYTLSQISGDDATPLRNTRPGIYRSGEEIVVRDNRSVLTDLWAHSAQLAVCQTPW
jgi:hypothetical protein